MSTLTLYDEAVDQEQHADKREASPEEIARLNDIKAITALQEQPGWPKLLSHLKTCRESLLADLTYAENPVEISRIQGAVHALNLFFGTTESLLAEGSFLNRIARNPKQ